MWLAHFSPTWIGRIYGESDQPGTGPASFLSLIFEENGVGMAVQEVTENV